MRILTRLLVATGLLALLGGPALAYDEGTWIFRGGVGTVQPKSNNFSELVGDTPVSIEVDNGTSMTLTGTYMFRKHWALDILASLPFQHDIDAVITDPDLGDIAVPIGKTKHLPPTLSVQYHFAPDAKFQPYIGAGVNYTTFFDTKLTSEFVELTEIEKLKLDGSFGFAAQLGGDWQINDQWILNFDVRYLDIGTDAALFGVDLDETQPDVRAKVDIGKVEIDPWVYAINLGYRF